MVYCAKKRAVNRESGGELPHSKKDEEQTQDLGTKPVPGALGLLVFSASEILELVDFGFGEGAEFPGGDVENEGAELGALNLFDEEADLLKHAADLAIAAFDEDDFVPGVRGVFDETDFGGRGFDAAAVVEGDGDAGAQALERFFAGLAADFDEIGFGNVGAGLGEFLGQGAIVGKEKKPFTGVIEAANGIDALGEFAEELHDGGAAFGIADGGDVAFRFVQEKIDETLRAVEGFAVDADGVGLRIGLSSLLGYDLAVKRDATGGDDFFGFAAGGDAGGGEDFLEAGGHGRDVSLVDERRKDSRIRK